MIVGQRRLIKNLRMKRYRQRKRVKNVGSLICHMKEREMQHVTNLLIYLKNY